MGFLDKMKETASKAAEQAKHATNVGKEKIEDARLQKKIRDLCEEIGALVVAQKRNEAPADAVAQIDAKVAEIAELEKQQEANNVASGGATEAADFRAFESIIREDATFRMPPQPDTAADREAMFKLWIEGGFGSERFGRLHCVVTHANLQPAVAAYVCQPGDSTWRALALDVLRIEDGLITEIVTFSPDTFPLFGLPMLMDPAPEMNVRH